MNQSSIRTLLPATISVAAISGANAAPPTKTGTTAKGLTQGKPLSTFVKDQKAGDASGDGFLNDALHFAHR